MAFCPLLPFGVPCRRSCGGAASYLNASPVGKDTEEEGEVLNKGAFF